MYHLSVVVAILALAGICSGVPSVFPVVPVRRPVVVPAEQLLLKPYEFGFEFGDGLGMAQHRREVSDGAGTVKGSYGYVDPLGLSRTVDYVANSNGYKAVVHSNEPGVAAQHTADAAFVVRPPPPGAVAQGLGIGVARIIH